MALTTDILRTWRGPRAVIRRILAQGQREDRLIFVAMVGCFLMFVAQLPVMARVAYLSREAAIAAPGREVLDLDMLIGTAFFGWMMIMPLVLYLAAGLSFLVLRVVRRPISGFGARLALFWSVLAAAPAALLAGLMNGLNGPGSGTTVAGILWLGAIAVFWLLSLREIMSGPGQAA